MRPRKVHLRRARHALSVVQTDGPALAWAQGGSVISGRASAALRRVVPMPSQPPCCPSGPGPGLWAYLGPGQPKMARPISMPRVTASLAQCFSCSSPRHRSCSRCATAPTSIAARPLSAAASPHMDGESLRRTCCPYSGGSRKEGIKRGRHLLVGRRGECREREGRRSH